MQNASVVQRAPENAAADAARALGWHTPDAVAANTCERGDDRPRDAIDATTHSHHHTGIK